MSTDRNYVNKHPRYSERIQTEALAPYGALYVEDRSGKVFDRLMRSLRRGDVVRVYRPFLLAPIKGQARTRRAKWAERVEAIKAKKCRIECIDPPNCKGARMAMVAYEDIASTGRGRAASGPSGRPNRMQDPEMRAKAEALWHDRRFKTRKLAAAAISNLAEKRITTGWCYSNFGKPGHES